MSTMKPGYETKPYPYPGDSREERAKRVALSYRALLQDVAHGRVDDPAGELHRLDMRWQSYGVYWHVPMPDLYEPDEWVSAPDLAHYIDRTRKDIYNWANAGHIERRTGPDGTPQYLVSSVIEYQKKLHARRARRGVT